jgi:uncharacterized protein YbjT (DUF2867 family)
LPHDEDAMKVAIVGGGRSGQAIERALLGRGLQAQLFSRSTGYDILSGDAAEKLGQLGQLDAIVEATGLFTTSKKVATDFFTRSTRAVGTAARTAGAKHVLLSIVNCEKPELQGYGYFAGKAEQERVAREANPNVTIIRSTQWFEFAEQNLHRFSVGPLALILAMKIQPVALAAVAEVIADSIVGARTGTSYDVAGPEVTTLAEMTERIRRKRLFQIPLAIPGATWREFRNGGLLPNAEIEKIGPRFSEWLAARGK